MKTILTLGFIVVCYINGLSQTICRSVVSSSGDFTSYSSTRLQFTIGETVIAFLSASGNQLREGYQQPDSVCMTTGIQKNPLGVESISISPNPASNIVKVRYNLSNNCKVNYAVFDCLGRQCLKINSGMHLNGVNEDPVEVSSLAAGSYILTVSYSSWDEKATNFFHLIITK
jgi:hypothetical protein